MHFLTLKKNLPTDFEEKLALTRAFPQVNKEPVLPSLSNDSNTTITASNTNSFWRFKFWSGLSLNLQITILASLKHYLTIIHYWTINMQGLFHSVPTQPRKTYIWAWRNNLRSSQYFSLRQSSANKRWEAVSPDISMNYIPFAEKPDFSCTIC